MSGVPLPNVNGALTAPVDDVLPADVRLREADRQAAVLAVCSGRLVMEAPTHAMRPSLAGLPELRTSRLTTDAAGLRAYQRHASALAGRLLRAAYPTVTAMLGDEALDLLAVRLWRSTPPASGDLGDWGEGLAGLIDMLAELRAWPWLADSARLDWAGHVCLRAADVIVEADSLNRLGEEDPAALKLRLVPGMRLISSPWPVAALRDAHRLPPERQADAAQQALEEGEHGSVLVWKPALRQGELAGEPQVKVRCVPVECEDWIHRLLAPAAGAGMPQTSDAVYTSGPSLDALLSATSPGFNFAAWLAEALRSGWLWRVERDEAP